MKNGLTPKLHFGYSTKYHNVGLDYFPWADKEMFLCQVWQIRGPPLHKTDPDKSPQFSQGEFCFLPVEASPGGMASVLGFFIAMNFH